MPVPQIIGAGASGCVFKPGIQCDELECDADCRQGISKLMSYEHAIGELHEISTVDEIDPEMKYHIGKPYLCRTLGHGIEKAIHDCNIPIDIPVTLNYQYGGKSLEEIIVAYDPTINISDIFHAFGNLIEGVQLFVSRQFVHHDIKPPNIVYNQKTKEMKFVDFGLSSSYDKILRNYGNDSGLVYHSYVHYPPDIMRIYGIPPTDYILNRRLYNMDSMVESYLGGIGSIDCEICDQAQQTVIDDIVPLPYLEDIVDSLNVVDVYGLGICLYLLATKFLSGEARKAMVTLSLHMTEPNYTKRYTATRAMEQYLFLLPIVLPAKREDFIIDVASDDDVPEILPSDNSCVIM